MTFRNNFNSDAGMSSWRVYYIRLLHKYQSVINAAICKNYVASCINNELPSHVLPYLPNKNVAPTYTIVERYRWAVPLHASTATVCPNGVPYTVMRNGKNLAPLGFLPSSYILSCFVFQYLFCRNSFSSKVIKVFLGIENYFFLL